MNPIKVSVFCVSYGKDAPWLPFMFKSCAKWLSGFEEIVLAFPTRDLKVLKKYCPWLWDKSHKSHPVFDCPVRLIEFDEEPLDGHMASLLAKCSADECVKGTHVLFIDSDCVWHSFASPELYFEAGMVAKPIWLYTPFTTEPDGREMPTHWRACTQEALGIPVAVETMRRHPSIIRCQDLAAFRAHIEQVHGKSLFDYLLPRKRHGQGKATFSEFCALGAFCYYFKRNNYCFMLDTSLERRGDSIFQFWSFHGVNHPSVQSKLKELDLL